MTHKQDKNTRLAALECFNVYKEKYTGTINPVWHKTHDLDL